MKKLRKSLKTVLLLFIVLITVIAIYELFLENSAETKYILYIENGDVKDDDLIISKSGAYISADCLTKNKVMDLFWDKEYDKISVFYQFKYIPISYTSDDAWYNEIKHDKAEILMLKNDKLYLNAKFIQENFIENMYIDEKSNNVIISDKQREYSIIKNTKAKYNGAMFSKYELKKGSKVYLYPIETGNSILCKISDDKIGFVPKSDIKPIKTVQEQTLTKPLRQKNITIAWDLISKKPTKFKEFDIPEGLDIILPTWFELDDTSSFFGDYSTDEYINYVYSNVKKIWGTFNNSFDKELTNEVLNNADKRTAMVDKIIEITQQKHLDGINIDFENVYMKDREVYNTFIKELYCKCLDKNIPMSVDVAVMSDSETWSKFLDRETIGKYSDYVMLMAYDEHVSGSSGSVSSLPWVDYGVTNLLESVDEGKVIMAVPFYTRLWEESEVNGKLQVKSTSLKLSSAKKVIDDLEINLSYDDKTMQNYGEKEIDGILCKVWYEDETSLKHRIDIMKKYNLVGKGVWALSYGIDEMWEVLSKYK